MANINTVKMFRIENPTIPSQPDGKVSHDALVGQWFSPDISTALNYLVKSTKRRSEVIDGAHLIVADVPVDDIDRLHAYHHPIASGMDIESDNYIIPRDGTIPTDTIPLDPIIGDLREDIRKFNVLSEAKQRIILALGEVAHQKQPAHPNH